MPLDELQLGPPRRFLDETGGRVFGEWIPERWWSLDELLRRPVPAG